MGWRVQEEYEKAQDKADREWLAGLSPRDRLRVRLWQAGRLSILVAVLLVVFGCFYAAHSAPIEPGAVEVVDGDTIRAHGQIFRLVGFDAPESGSNARCEAERTLAARATFRLRQLVSGGGLDLERVPCACQPGTEGTRRCNFGRLCGLLKARGRDVGTILITEGLARPYICGKTRCPKRETWCESGKDRARVRSVQTSKASAAFNRSSKCPRSDCSNALSRSSQPSASS
jgi:endonuclease YncB( thermonuclease family)